MNERNAVYLTTNSGGELSGPKRCGIIAASAITNNREETGGTYYGIMEMTGNVYERAISTGNPEGRAFTGEHRDGIINAGGDHNVANWPTGNEGIGYRGGGYPNDIQFITVSDRNDAALWLDAASLPASEPLAQWPDRSGNERNG